MDDKTKDKLAELQKQMLLFQQTHMESFSSENGEILGTINANMEITAFTIDSAMPARQMEGMIRTTINKAIVKMASSVRQAMKDITKAMSPSA